MVILKRIINFAVVSIPLFLVKGMDTREPKEILCLCLCIVIVLLGTYRGLIKQPINKFLLLIVGFQFISLRLAPEFKINFFNQQWMNIWGYETILHIALFAAVIIVISNIRFRARELRKLLSWMAFTGFLMSLYIFIQSLGMDQFFVEHSEAHNPDIKWLTASTIVGTMGNSTIVSPFVAMNIPIAWYLKRRLWAVSMFAAVLCCQSKMATGAMVVGIILYVIATNWFVYRRKFIPILAFSFLIFAVGVSSMFYLDINSNRHLKAEGKFMDSGRIANWTTAYKDWSKPPMKSTQNKFMLTGFGPGNYGALYQIRNGSRWGQMHNEYGEILYNNGIIGFGLFVSFFASIYLITIKRLEEFNAQIILCLLASLTIISLDALGSFPWQIAPTLFYTLVVVGLLQNQQILRERLI